MSSTWIYPDLSQDDIAVIDALCDRFETCWKHGERPAIEDYLAETTPRLHDVLGRELLQVEVELRQAQGETPRAADYDSRFPGLSDSIHEALHATSSDPPPTASDIGINSAAHDTNVSAVPLSAHSFPAGPPREFGRYRIEHELGRGGMGTVYLARDQELDRPVALKVPHPHLIAAEETFLERFRREARAMATVRHPNVCPIFDVGAQHGWHYLTMAYIDGETLSARLHRGDRFSFRAAAELIRQIALAVHAIHRAGVLHRDLKPANIMLDREGAPIVMDFGLARDERPEGRDLSHSGNVVGTPAYMAPEQIEQRNSEIGPVTDVYALGVILYELVSGRRPFEGSSASVLGQVIYTSATAPSQLDANVPPQIEAICLKAMAKSPTERYASAKQLADELSQWLSAPAVDSQQKPASPVPVAHSIRRERLQLAIAIATLAIVAAYGAFLLPRHPHHPPPHPHHRPPPPWRESSGFVGVPPSGVALDASNSRPAEAGTPTQTPSPTAEVAVAPFDAERAAALQQAWSTTLKTPVEITPAIDMRFRLIPPGEFAMGASTADSDASSDERPQHTAQIARPFYAAVHEVTVGQFRRFVEATRYQTEAETNGRGSNDARRIQHTDWTWRRHSFEPADDSPVSCVTWHDAQQFLTWLSKETGRPCRLPTEAEWEYLCRAGSIGAYWWGNDRDSTRLQSAERPPAFPLKVGQHVGNAFGLHDTHGNVWEWCLDGQRTYKSSATEDPAGSLDPATPRIVRGGGWTTAWASLRATRRAVEAIDYSHHALGFRVVMEIGAESSTPRLRPAFTATDVYERQTIRGFKILLHPKLNERPVVRDAVVTELERQLAEIANAVPDAALRELRRTWIWVDWSILSNRSAFTHYSTEWLSRHGFNPELAGGIQIVSPPAWLAAVQPPVGERILTLLADQYLVRVDSAKQAPLEAAYRHAMEQKLYDAVVNEQGQTVRSWATRDARAYFNTLSQAYFLRGGHYPFTRDEFREHDPQGFDAIELIWNESAASNN